MPSQASSGVHGRESRSWRTPRLSPVHDFAFGCERVNATCTSGARARRGLSCVSAWSAAVATSAWRASVDERGQQQQQQQQRSGRSAA
mmetsp:Transcript_12802/g.40866  ORF Transcript_12802/g.40866 Transcript_12802/m.40866 type:complete len:88 (-) Transcript_12802:444-707(-)